MQANIRVGILFFFILLVFNPISLLADEISFRCIVKNEYQLTDDGQLVSPEKYFRVYLPFKGLI